MRGEREKNLPTRQNFRCNLTDKMTTSNTLTRGLHLLKKTYTDWQCRGIRYATARILEKLVDRLDNIKTAGIVEDENTIISINRSWSNDYGMVVEGWVLSKKNSLQKVQICMGDCCVPISTWYSRPDVSRLYPQYCRDDRCGFIVYIPRFVKHQVSFHLSSANETDIKTVCFSGSRPSSPIDSNHVGGLFEEFCTRVNEKNLHVLEIGSRVVSPGSQSKRSLFPNAASYTGFDYYPDNNTDVVGDAHQLSSYFGDRKFDAIFSVSVLEHLAMPWLVAKEINQLLEMGGLTFHATHFSWPLHESPWDFWRFSDEGLKVLFSPPLGFKVLRSGLFTPMRMHPDVLLPGQELLPHTPGFGGTSILAQKVANVDSDRFQWQTTLANAIGTNSQYPQPKHHEK